MDFLFEKNIYFTIPLKLEPLEQSRLPAAIQVQEPMSFIWYLLSKHVYKLGLEVTKYENYWKTV